MSAKGNKAAKKKPPPISLTDLDVDKGWLSIDGLFKILELWSKTQPCIGRDITLIEAFDKINSIVSEQLIAQGYRGENPGTGKLGTLFSKTELKKTESSITAYFQSLPRQYSFFFYCPQLSHKNLGFKGFNSDFGTIECVTKDTSATVKRVMARRFGSDEDEHRDGIPYGFHFRISASGYAKNQGLNSASAMALRRFKHLFIGFLLDKRLEIGFGGGFWGERDGAVYVVDHANPSVVEKIEISEGLRKFLSKVRLPQKPKDSDEGDVPKGLLAMDQGLPERFPLEISRGLKIFLDYKISTDDVDCIRTAAEWLFDAKLNGDDPSLKVMQISAAAEAVLAEGKKIEQNVTKTLSDRCAYLLGYNAGQRANIRKWFSEFYNVRSHLVHGRSRVLSADNNRIVSWAEHTAELILDKELRFLAPRE